MRVYTPVDPGSRVSCDYTSMCAVCACVFRLFFSFFPRIRRRYTLIIIIVRTCVIRAFTYCNGRLTHVFGGGCRREEPSRRRTSAKIYRRGFRGGGDTCTRRSFIRRDFVFYFFFFSKLPYRLQSREPNSDLVALFVFCFVTQI